MNLDHDAWRHSLYPLGFIASALFGLRFVWQWLRSERVRKSHVDEVFWKISLAGNSLMALHYFFQVHFFLCLFQAINGMLAWRNLRLLHAKASLSWKARLMYISLLTVSCTILFLIQSWLWIGEVDWVRSPHTHLHPQAISLSWHILGFLGASIFSMRFWLQWWKAEETSSSQLQPWFWWLSLVGALILCVYARMMNDPVTLIANALPLTGYLRNIVLIRRAELKSYSKNKYYTTYYPKSWNLMDRLNHLVRRLKP